MDKKKWLSRKSRYRCKCCGETKSYGFLAEHLVRDHGVRASKVEDLMENYEKIAVNRA